MTTAQRCRALVAALLTTRFVVVGCGSSKSSTTSGPTLTPAAQQAQQKILAICGVANDQAVKAAGGAEALEAATNTLVAEAKRLHDPAMARTVDQAMRAESAGKECAPGYADRIQVALLPQTPRQTVKATGFPGFRGEDDTYYATHYGAGESKLQRECVTEAGEMRESVEALENFLYLLNVGSPRATSLLAVLKHDCVHGGL